MEVRERYNKLYEEFAKIDDINLEGKVKLVPAQKHFWSARLIDTKNELYTLLKAKKKVKRALVQEKVKNSPVAVAITKAYLDKVDDDPSLESINERIQDIELTIEALKYHYSNITYISQDF